MGSILDRIKKDARRIISDKNGFAVEIKISTPDGDVEKTIAGLATKHHLGVDTDGNMVNARNAHCSFSEKDLIAAGYPARHETTGEIDLKDHIVSWADITDTVKDYVIKQVHPDETLGIILCILAEYVED